MNKCILCGKKFTKENQATAGNVCGNCFSIIDINPFRQTAVRVLEALEDRLATDWEGIWYELEDKVTEILQESFSKVIRNDHQIADVLKRFKKMDEEDREGDFNRVEFLLNEFAYFFEEDPRFDEKKLRKAVLGE